MGSKYFLVNPNIDHLTPDEVQEVEAKQQEKLQHHWESREARAKEAFEEQCNLKHTYGRVIVKADLEAKNYHTFSNGLTIRRERNFNEFNRRITQPVNAICISGEDIEPGSEILISHNALHDTNKIFSYKSKSPDIQYYSLPEYDCFAWRDKEGNMRPMKNFEFGLRVFKPYSGPLEGIAPTLIKDTLYITTGLLAGKVAHTLKASDYEIIFQGLDGKEDRLIRISHSEDENFDREEIIAIADDLTEQVACGTLLVGLEPSNCVKLVNAKSQNIPGKVKFKTITIL